MIKKVLKALTGEYMLTGKKYYQKGKEFLQCYEDARFVQSFIDSPRLNKMVGDYDDGWDKDSDAAIHHRMDTAPFVRVFESFVTAVKPSHGENFWAKESIEVNADGAERGQKHIEHDARGAIGAALRHFLDEYWWGEVEGEGKRIPRTATSNLRPLFLSSHCLFVVTLRSRDLRSMQ